MYNLNVTEVLVSDFKDAFPGIFNFTIGILTDSDSYLEGAYGWETQLGLGTYGWVSIS